MYPETEITKQSKKSRPIAASPEFQPSSQAALGVLLKLRLVWGWLLFPATVVFSVILRIGAYELIPWLGAALTVLGFGSSVWILIHHRDSISQASLALICNWAGGYLGMAVILVGVYAKTRYPLFIPPVVAAGMGLNCWLTASVYKKRLQSGLAFSWWCGALVMWVVGTDYTVLFLVGLFIGLELVPDWLLFHRVKREACKATGNRQ